MKYSRFCNINILHKLNIRIYKSDSMDNYNNNYVYKCEKELDGGNFLKIFDIGTIK